MLISLPGKKPHCLVRKIIIKQECEHQLPILRVLPQVALHAAEWPHSSLKVTFKAEGEGEWANLLCHDFI